MAESTRPLRVLILLDILNIGGAERQAFLLAESFAENNRFEPVVVSLQQGGTMESSLQSYNFSVHTFPFLFKAHWFARVKEMILYARRLRSIKPDIILPFTIRPNVIANFAWQLSGAKACCWNQRDEGFGFPIDRDRIFNRSFNNASVLIANSQSTKKSLEKFSGNQGQIPIRLIHNGVRKSNEQYQHKRFQLPESAKDRPVVTMIANLTARKDHETVIRAFGNLKKNLSGSPMPFLVLAGSKESKYELLNSMVSDLNLQEDVFFAGLVDDVSGLLQKTHIGINSSVSEGLPNSVLENMMEGKAVVANDILAHREVLGNDYPYFFTTGNPVELAQHVDRLIKNPQERLLIGNRNKLQAEKQFSVKSMVSSYQRLFGELLGVKD